MDSGYSVSDSVFKQHPHVRFANYGFGCQDSGEVPESIPIH